MAGEWLIGGVKVFAWALVLAAWGEALRGRWAFAWFERCGDGVSSISGWMDDDSRWPPRFRTVGEKPTTNLLSSRSLLHVSSEEYASRSLAYGQPRKSPPGSLPVFVIGGRGVCS